MTDINKLIRKISDKKNVKIGLNSANKALPGCEVIYTVDAPHSKLYRREGVKYTEVDVIHSILTKGLGLDYGVHFITING